jgi:uncharacterized integral membrane protein
VTYEEPKGTTPARPSWRPSGREIGAFVLIILVLVFALVNWEQQKIHLVFGDVEMPIFFVIAFPALIAFGAGMFFQRQRLRRRR